MERDIMLKNGGIIGVSDHGGWAVLVTVTGDGTLLDRRRVELVDDSLPAIPHHHEGQMLPVDEAVALVGRVRVSAERHAVLALDAVAAAVPLIRGIALRTYPDLPPTIAERLKDYRARNVADWVMYRQALAGAAAARGWSVRRCTSRTSMPTFSSCEAPSVRHGTRITNLQWRRRSSPHSLVFRDAPSAGAEANGHRVTICLVCDVELNEFHLKFRLLLGRPGLSPPGCSRDALWTHRAARRQGPPIRPNQ
jgi:hypothetical protein